MDVLNDLWNKQSEQAATLYFGCYEKAAQSYFPGICEGEKIQLSNIREKADQSIISLLEASKDKIPFSRTLLDSIHATEYPADSAMLQRLQNLREVALLEGMLKLLRLPSTGLMSRSIPTENSSHKSTPPKTYGSTNW